MTLEVIISTHRPVGIENVVAMNLPSLPNVSYLVCWQQSDGAKIPKELLRNDVRILRNPGNGLSNNRNFGMENATGDVILFADDDLFYSAERLAVIVPRFEKDPDLDIATFMSESPTTPLYPKNSQVLNRRLPKGYWVTSYEMALRRSSAGKLRFDERFGLGSGKFECGEEELFHLKARRNGLKCMFFPDIIVEHNHHSTGTGYIDNPLVLMGMGAVIVKAYPFSWILRVPLKAWRLYKGQQARFFLSLVNLFRGAFKSLFMKL